MHFSMVRASPLSTPGFSSRIGLAPWRCRSTKCAADFFGGKLQRNRPKGMLASQQLVENDPQREQV